MRFFTCILILLSPFVCLSQTTTNIILNNSFEIVNTNSPLYQASSHDALLRDSNFNSTAIPCWVNANQYSQTIDYDTFTVRVNPAILAAIYPENKIRSLSFFSGNFFNSGDTTINPPISLFETKFRYPLNAGSTYYLSGYINAYLDSFFPNCARCDTVSYSLYIYSYVKKLGINFSADKIYFDNSNYQPNFTPTLTFNIPLFTYQYIYNPWYKFEITYTAIGGEQYLTIGNFDSTRANVAIYPALDSITQNFRPGISLDSFNIETNLYLDNLTLIPLSDTGLTVINPHISDPDSILLTHDTLVCRGSVVITLSTAANFWTYVWSTGRHHSLYLSDRTRHLFCHRQ